MHANLTRFQAFLIHLFISSVILGSFLSIVFFIWYPPPFFVVEGLVQIVWVLVGVDIVLGPALTLVVFKSGKPGLKRDLSIIAGIQILGFVYGAHTFFVERPAFAVIYDSDYFDVVSASSMKEISKSDESLGYSGISGPAFVYVDAPTEIDDLKTILEDMKKGGPSIDRRLEYFRPLKGFINKKYRFSKDLDELYKIPQNQAEIDKFRSRYGERIDEFAFFPITGKLTSRLLAIDKNTETVVDYIDINPRPKSRQVSQ